MSPRLTDQEVDALAARYSVSRGRILIWDKEGMHTCTECGEAILVSRFERPTHVRFNVSGHHARFVQESLRSD